MKTPAEAGNRRKVAEHQVATMLTQLGGGLVAMMLGAAMVCVVVLTLIVLAWGSHVIHSVLEGTVAK